MWDEIVPIPSDEHFSFILSQNPENKFLISFNLQQKFEITKKNDPVNVKSWVIKRFSCISYLTSLLSATNIIIIQIIFANRFDANWTVPPRLCPYMIGPTRLGPHTFEPRHVCAHTRLCPDTFVPTHVCAQTRLCPHTFVPRHVCLCPDTFNLCPDMIVPRHDCAQTRLCPDTFVPRHVCAQTRLICAQTWLCPNTFVPRHVCAQTSLICAQAWLCPGTRSAPTRIVARYDHVLGQ